MFLISSNCLNNKFKFIPLSMATFEESCITGPSAIGSENGIPISIRSTPHSSRVLMISVVSFRLG